MGTFLGSYRLEKRSKSHGVSENLITIGIPIQMNICRFPLFELHFRPLVKSAGKMTSWESYWVSDAELRVCCGRRMLFRAPRSSESEVSSARNKPRCRTPIYLDFFFQWRRICDMLRWSWSDEEPMTQMVDKCREHCNESGILVCIVFHHRCQ